MMIKRPLRQWICSSRRWRNHRRQPERGTTGGSGKPHDELGLKKEDYWWYLDLRKYGGTRHAGFGLGFERAVMYLTGVGNIRDVLPYPRTVNNAEF